MRSVHTTAVINVFLPRCELESDGNNYMTSAENLRLTANYVHRKCTALPHFHLDLSTKPAFESFLITFADLTFGPQQVGIGVQREKGHTPTVYTPSRSV